VRKRYLEDESFNVENARKGSKALGGLCAWVRAMDVYERVAKVVKPKQLALAQAELELKDKMDALNEKKTTLQRVEDELAELQSQFEAATARKEDLEIKTEDTRQQLLRAELLIGGLGGEKARWTLRAAELDKQFRALTGDVLLASGIISYLGAFTIEFRADCIRDWQDRCLELRIPSTALIAHEERKSSRHEAEEGWAA
jgi:dynein heavy chain